MVSTEVQNTPIQRKCRLVFQVVSEKKLTVIGLRDTNQAKKFPVLIFFEY